MKFAVALLALAGAASASLVARQSLPTCAITCISQADLGGCSSTDNACLCKNNAFVTSTTTCIESTCSGSDLQNALAASQALCAAVGVTLTSDSSTPASSATGAPASSGTPATTGSSASKSGSSSSPAAASQTSPAASSTPSKSAGKINSANALGGLAALGLAALAL